jgi:hypothetical protein
MKIEAMVLVVKLSDGSVRELSTTKDTQLSVLNLINNLQGLNVGEKSFDSVHLNYPDNSTLTGFSANQPQT